MPFLSYSRLYVLCCRHTRAAWSWRRCRSRRASASSRSALCRGSHALDSYLPLRRLPWCSLRVLQGRIATIGHELLWCTRRPHPYLISAHLVTGKHASQGRVASHSAAELLRCSGGGDLAASDLVPGQYEGADWTGLARRCCFWRAAVQCLNCPSAQIIIYRTSMHANRNVRCKAILYFG